MQPEQYTQSNMPRKKRKGFLIPALFILAFTSLILLVIFLFSHPTVYFSKNSGFTEHDAVKTGKNKLRFVVPETIDTTKSTFISIRKEWFTTSRLGTIVDIKAKPGKYLALDFTDRQHDSEVFTIYTKNWFGIKKQFDVIVDYSNFLRIFFPESHDGAIPRKPEILPYSKLQTEYKHKYEELYKIKSFYAYDKDGKIAPEPIHRRDVFSKDIAQGRAFIVNNSTQISLIYDFLLPGIFKNQAQKTQVYDLVDKTVGKAKTLDPEKQGHEIQFNTPPFYISKFLGWYYIDPTGNRVDLKPGEEFNIPTWVKSELRLIAKYDITADIDKLAPALDKQGLVAVSYFDGVQRVFLDIVKRGTPLREHIYNKDGYVYEGWYKDSGFTKKVDFSQEVATTHISLYLKSTSQNQPQPEKPTKYHTITFKTPDGASQLSPAKVARDQKLDANYAAPNRVSKVYPDGKLEELDYWTIWDPVNNQDTGVKFDFNTPITSDLVLYAHLRPYKAPDSERPVTFKVLDHIKNQTLYDKTLTAVNNKIQDADKAEINGILRNAPADVETPMGTYRFKGWYLNGDINSPFNIDDALSKNIKRFEIHAVYDFEPNDKVPNPQDPDNPLPLDPNLVKLTFLTPERTVLSVQTQEKGKAYAGTLPTISKLGYVFKHWAYFENNEVKDQFDTTAVLNDNKVLYPVFEKDPNANLENEELQTVKIYNPLLKSTQVLKVKKGELLGVDTNAYTTTIEDKEYVFDKFTTEDGTAFDHLTTQITQDLNLTVNLKEKELDGFKLIDAKISDPVQGKVLYEGKIRIKDGQIYAPDRAKLQAILDTVGADIDTVLGKYRFKGWYLNGDTNSPFTVNDNLDPNATNLTVKAVYYFEDNNKVPNPDNPSDPQPLDPTLIKVTFLSDNYSVISVQTSKKGKVFDGTLPNVEKRGYIFKHWVYFKAGVVGSIYNEQDVLTENTVLYPVFEKDPSEPEPQNTVKVTMQSELLGQSEHRFVKKGTKLDLDPQQFNTKVGKYLYKFKRFVDENGNTFDYKTKPITKDITLKIEYEKTEPKAKYTIKHVFEGVEGQIPETTQTVEKETTVGSEITVDSSDGLPGLDHGFDLVDSTETKVVKADGSTEFILNYKRKEFTVTYQANYHNQFPGTTVSNEPQTHKVKYQEKIKEPNPAPKLERHGRTYTFKHWQLESTMNGVYSEQSPYNFNTRVNRNVDLVAYFEEKIEKINYKIVHMLEKQGESSALNGQYDRIEELQQDKKVEDGATYQDYSALDSNLYEKDAAHPDNLLNAQLNTGDNTTEVRQYYKLKETTVNFRKTAGIQSFDSAETIVVKKTRKIDLPNYNLKANYEFTGWSLSQNGPSQANFIASGNSLDIYANTRILESRVKYTILTQRADGGYDTTYETKNALIGSVHTASYANPNSSIYQDPRFNPVQFTVSANENENQVTVTIDRNVYTVTFEVIGHNGTILNRVIRHGNTIGAIDESQFAADGIGIIKAELDGNEKDKAEIENFVVQKNHKVTLHIGRLIKKFGKYPQTKVDNPSGIHHLEDKNHSLNFNSKGKDYTMHFTRSYWQDNSGNKYEKYDGQYFKIEDVIFVKIPKLNTWYTDKIIDFSPFNISKINYPDDAKPERSIFKSLVKDIGKVLGGEVHMPTYDSGDFQVKPAYDANIQSRLIKETTDYAKAILGSNDRDIREYRGFDLTHVGGDLFSYRKRYHSYWWLATQVNYPTALANLVRNDNILGSGGVSNIFGVVVCIR